MASHAATIATHTTQIGDLQTADTTISNAATALALRVTKAESLTAGSSSLVTAVLALQAADTAIQSAATALTTRVANAEALTGGTALATTVAAHGSGISAAVNVNTAQQTLLNFLATRPWFEVRKTVDQALVIHSVVTLQSAAQSATGATYFSWNSAASKVTLRGSVAGDADAGMLRRFQVIAQIRLTLSNAYFDWIISNLPSVSTVQASGHPSATLVSIVEVAPGATLSVGMAIANIAEGGGIIDPSARTCRSSCSNITRDGLIEWLQQIRLSISDPPSPCPVEPHSTPLHCSQLRLDIGWDRGQLAADRSMAMAMAIDHRPLGPGGPK